MASPSSRLRWASGAGLTVLSAVAATIAACSPRPSAPATPPAPAVVPADPEPAGPPAAEAVPVGAGSDAGQGEGEEAGPFASAGAAGGGLAGLAAAGEVGVEPPVPGGGRYDGKKVLGNPCKLYRNLGDW